MKVTLRPEAEEDLESAARWYEERRRGLGGGSWMKFFTPSRSSRKTQDAIREFTGKYAER